MASELSPQQQETLDELRAAQEEGFCFHGSPASIEGFLKPSQGYGHEEHERHRAVYASLDLRPALMKATVAFTGESGHASWKWCPIQNKFSFSYSNIAFRSGWIYLLDPKDFEPSGSSCKTEMISLTAVLAIKKVLVQPELFKTYEGVTFNPSLTQ